MTVELNHTIVWSRDSAASAAFLSGILGLPSPQRFGPFQVVAMENGVNLDFMDKDGDIAGQHYAFLVSEEEFDRIFGRVKERGLRYWADPANHQRGRNQHPRWRARVLFQGPGWSHARGYHPTLWQRRVSQHTAFVPP